MGSDTKLPDNASKPFPGPSSSWPPSGYPQTPPQPIVRPNPDKQQGPK